MKRTNRFFLLSIILCGMILPFIPAATSQVEDFRFSLGIGATAKDWDPISNGGSSPVQDYSWNALESLMIVDRDYSGQNEDWIPHLATSWVLEYWPEELNGLGTMNAGGIKSIELTLRTGVKFHDGSDFNATVAKWNIDRKIVGDGNLTGNGLKKWLHTSYAKVSDYTDYYTASWDLSAHATALPEYLGYNDCQDEGMRGYVPIISGVEITEDLQSGGKIKITSNHWNSGLLGMLFGMAGNGALMLSMEAYEDYFDTPILGYGNDPSFPQTPTEAEIIAGNYPSTGFPGHMIGTGPYKYIIHDETASPAGGTMIRNDDWWNAAAVQARGGFEVDYFDLVWFPFGAGGGEALLSTALVTGELDIGFHLATANLNYDDVMNSTFVDWIDTTLDPNLNIISLNCIEDWDIPDEDLYPLTDDHYGNKSIRQGIPRAWRKAVSYAFDYDTYVNVVRDGRAARARYVIGTSSPWYNPSLPYCDFDVDVARETLLNDAYFGPLATARGLTASSTDAEWEAVATSNPLYTFDYGWDIPHEDVNNELRNAVKRIGSELNQSAVWKYDPRCFTEIYLSMFYGAGTWPFYTGGGFNMLWPWADAAPPIRAMLRSEQPWNLGFSYNSTADAWMDQLQFASPAQRQILYDNLATWFNTYQYAYVVISQDKNGFAINSDYELDYVFEGIYQLPARVRDKGWSSGFQIPGYSVEVLTLFSFLGVIAIVYTINRKRRI